MGDSENSLLAEIGDAGSTFSREDVCQRTVDAIDELLAFDACECLMDEGGTLARKACAVPDVEVRQSGSLIGDAGAERVYRSQEPLLVGDVTGDDRFDLESGYRSLLGVPLGTHGVVQLAANDPDAFDERDLSLVEAFCGYAAQMLDRLDSSQSAVAAMAEDLLEVADVMMIVLDAAGRIVFTNRKAREILGYDEGELLGRDWFEACLPERDRDDVADVFARLMAGQTEPAERAENPVRTKGGEERRIEWHNTVLRDGDGEIIGTLSSGLDVTARRESERRLREEREKYATLVENSNDGIAIIQNGTFAFVNERFAEFHETTREDLLGEPFLTHVDPAYRDLVRRRYEQRMAGGSPEMRYEIEILDGKRTLEINAARIEYEGGPADMGIVRDVTERKRREREIETARRRYRTLLQAAPDPVFVVDADTGDVVEANDAAAAFRGQSREEIVGLHRTALHPTDDADGYRELFEEWDADGGTRRRLPNGDPIHAVTADGERVPVEISTETADLADGTVVYAVFRDIEDQLAYERALTGLNEATAALFETETPSAVGHHVVEAVTDTLGFAGATVYLIDEDDGVFRPVAHASRFEVSGAPLLDSPTLEPGGNIVWQVYSRGDTEVIEGGRSDEGVYGSETPVRREIVVQLGDHGVLVVGDTRVGSHDPRAVELLEILGVTADAALERAEREQRLKAHEQRLRRRTERLERVEALNARIREVARAVVQATTRQEVERAVCTQLVASDVVSFAWIGEVDPITDTLTTRATAGDHHGYLDDVDLSLADDAVSEPAVKTARTHEPTVVDNTATNIAGDDWRRGALQRGFQSAMSVPLAYQDTGRGVLTVYSPDESAFSKGFRAVMSELGELVAHAVVATERKQALLSNQVTELEFDIRDRTCFFLRFTRQADCSVELERIIPQPDDSSLVFVRVADGSPEQLLAAAERSSMVDSSRLIETDGDALVQLGIVEPFIASQLADHGITVRDISADGSECRVTVAVPPTFGVHQVVDTVSTLYDETEVLAKREQTQYSPGTFTDRVLGKLTPRQREVVETAYFSGYFDAPRGVSGEALAAELGFSSSAFHRHIRTAERKLFETLFENGPPPARE
jgi:PAS domain S-box-containing protein